MEIKSCTDLEQSKKLKEFLPIESADRHYWLAWRGGISKEYKNIPKVGIPKKYKQRKYLWCPCWSLAALLSVLPEIKGSKPIIALDDNYITYPHINDLYTKANNLIDACVDMIIKLNKQNLL